MSPKPVRRKKNGTNRTPKKAVTRANTKRWQDKFIDELRARGIVADACKAAGVGRTTAYHHRKESPEFTEAWVGALCDAADMMESEAWRRAVRGVKKPVYQQKELVGYVQEYSDTLLIFLLKGARPEKYRERFEVKADWRAEARAQGLDPDAIFESAVDAAISAGSRGIEGAGVGGGETASRPAGGGTGGDGAASQMESTPKANSA